MRRLLRRRAHTARTWHVSVPIAAMMTSAPIAAAIAPANPLVSFRLMVQPGAVVTVTLAAAVAATMPSYGVIRWQRGSSTMGWPGPSLHPG